MHGLGLQPVDGPDLRGDVPASTIRRGQSAPRLQPRAGGHGVTVDAESEPAV